MTDLNSIVADLEALLHPTVMEDASYNGVQIYTASPIERIYGGVDATLDFLKSAPKPDKSLYLVHHGLFWSRDNPSLIGSLYEKTKFCYQHQSALYASHLPLDVHPVHGNNIGILRALSLPLDTLQPFGLENNTAYGFQISSNEGWSLHSLLKTASQVINPRTQLLSYGQDRIHTIAVISGSGYHFFPEAVHRGIDLFITGDYAQSMYIQARDNQKNVLLLGHYESEIFGVLSIGHYLAKRFSLEFTFLDVSPIVMMNTN